MNRTTFRGVTAACLSGLAIAIAGIVGTALAAGTAAGQPRVAVDSRGLAPHTPIRPAPAARHERPRPRPTPTRASRSAVRRPLVAGSPRTVAHALLLRDGWSEGQWSCLDMLWTRESGWQVGASNGRSGAYGIPQALPGSKMAAMGSDWRTDAVTQIRWGLWYIGTSYGSPCDALAHSDRYGFY